MKKILIALFLISFFSKSYAQTCSDMCVPVTVTTQASSHKITLSWVLNPTAVSINIYKKLKEDGIWNSPTSVSTTATSWTDSLVTVGQPYEYWIQMGLSGTPNQANTYLYAAIDAAPTHYHGKMILLVDENYLLPLATEINQFKTDLIADGWLIYPVAVARNVAVDSVKKIVSQIYLAQYSSINSILILGHVAVPYSGNINPDGHPDHLGAWPCDAFYGDFNNTYTDVSVNNATASRTQNQNIPGDGKYDNSSFPAAVNMNVARVDLFNLPTFTINDTLLMQHYFAKDHSFKTGLKTFRKRMLISDNFGYFSGEAFAQNGWRCGFANVGVDSSAAGNYFTDMQTGSYLWSYGTGGGTYTSAGGVGTTAAFSTYPLNNAFTMMFGSYFGDWDSQDNFLRAALANPGDVLTNCWAGRPNWFFHYLSLGEPFSECIMKTQNNTFLYQPTNYGNNWIHTGFMGDLSLRQDYFSPCTTLTSSAINANSQVQLSWAANAASGVLGYYIYRSKSIADSFQLITSTYTTGTSFTDLYPLAGKNVYMLRAVRNEQSITGSYFNLCLGRFDSIQNITPTVGIVSIKNDDEIKIFPNPANVNDAVRLSFSKPNSGVLFIKNELGQTISEQLFKNKTTVQLNTTNLSAGLYFVEIKNVVGEQTPTTAIGDGEQTANTLKLIIEK